MENFTVDRNFTGEISRAFTSALQIGVVEFLSGFNLFFSITALLSNALIIVALHKAASLHPPTKLFFRCLAIADLSVGAISQPLFAVFLLLSATTGMKLEFIFYTDKLSKASSFVLCPVSVFTSTAISVDRLLALLSGLRYRHVVTLPRIRAVITFFWLIGVSTGLIYFWSNGIAFLISFSLIIFSLTASVFFYSTIYFKLRRHRLQVSPLTQGQPNRRELPLNIARYKNSVSSAIWVQIALLVCYIPLPVVVMLVAYGQIPGSQSAVAFYVARNFVYLNSSLNPILYCWKIREVRRAVVEILRPTLCLSPN